MAEQNNAPLPEGLEIAGYRIIHKIASGGFSIVYLASDEEGNAVAIKEYLPSSLVVRQAGDLTPSIPTENLPIFFPSAQKSKKPTLILSTLPCLFN